MSIKRSARITVVLLAGLAFPGHAPAATAASWHRDAWDALTRRLAQGKGLSQARAEALFDAGGSVVVGHYRYGMPDDAAAPVSDIVDYANADGRMGAGIADLRLEVIGPRSAVLRLTVRFRPDTCIRARDVIARYGLQDTPPPDPNPGARAVEFARTYPGGNLWLYVPVPPATIPETMVRADSCVSEIGIFSNAPLPLRH